MGKSVLLLCCCDAHLVWYGFWAGLGVGRIVERGCFSAWLVSFLSYVLEAIANWDRVAAAEGFFIMRADWTQAVRDAQMRNNMG